MRSLPSKIWPWIPWRRTLGSEEDTSGLYIDSACAGGLLKGHLKHTGYREEVPGPSRFYTRQNSGLMKPDLTWPAAVGKVTKGTTVVTDRVKKFRLIQNEHLPNMPFVTKLTGLGNNCFMSPLICRSVSSGFQQFGRAGTTKCCEISSWKARLD